MSEPDPSKRLPSATGVFRSSTDDATFEADFADLAARFAAQSGGGLSPELSADLALEIVLNEVVEQACLSTGATGAAIVLPRDGEMVCRASTGATAPELGARFDAGSGLSGECIRTRQTQRCDDVLADQRVDIEASARLGVRSVMAMPLLRGTELVGVFELFSSLPGAFGERDERTLEALAGRILNNLMLSSREVVVEPPLERPLEPPPAPSEDLAISPAASVSEPESVSGPLVVPPPLVYQPLAVSASATAASSVSEPSIPEPSVSEPLASAAFHEAIAEVAEDSPQRRFDFVTAFLGAAVLACAVLLGILLGRHFGFQKVTARVHPAAPISSANPIAPLVVVSSPSAENDAQKKASGTAAPMRASGDAIPPGSLRVYDNGKEVFRQSPVQTGDRDETAQTQSGSSAEQGSGMQRASTLEPERIEMSSAAAENSVLHRVEPEYPEDARQMQLQGPVVLDVHIRQDGSVQGITLVSGQPLLVQAAKAAVQQWRFKPRSVNGRPTAMETRITLTFRLPQ
jgi:TonB family protein